MKIQIFGLNYAPEQIGIGRYTGDMAQSLAARGHAVEVVCAPPYYPAWQVARPWQGARWRRSIEQGIAVTRCPIYVPGNPTGARRIAHLFSFALSALWPVIALLGRSRRARPDLVICVVPALFCVPVAWLAARLSGAKLWLHVQDFEVEAGFAMGLVGRGALVQRLVLGMERRLLALGDTVSSISPQMCARLRDKRIDPARVIELRNWADITIRPDPGQGAAYRSAWALAERKIGLYSGNIGNKQGIEILIEVARLLQHRGDFTILICGDGPNRARLEALAQGLDNIAIRGLQPSERMSELLGLAYLHLLPQLPGAADLVLPSKLTNMLASARPVIATAAAGTGLYDEVSGCGLCTAPGDAAALAAAIEHLLDRPALAERLGKSGPARVLERSLLSAIIDRFELRAREITTPRRARTRRRVGPIFTGGQ
jgi:colanic acid biosynthesis glycosyl transferase WcaI